MSQWQDNLRVVAQTEEDPDPEPYHSDAQQALIDTYDKARVHAKVSIEQTAESLAWASNIESDIPAEYRAIPQLVGRYENWLKDRQRIRTGGLR